MKKEFSIDEVDMIVLEILKKDSRLSAVSIAQEANISALVVRRRIRQMEEDGIIGKYEILIDYRLLGFNEEVFILLNVYHEDIISLITLAKSLPEITEAHRITGNHNLLLKAVLEDKQQLGAIKDKIKDSGFVSALKVIPGTVWSEYPEDILIPVETTSVK